MMQLSDFTFQLPDELIAHFPMEKRSQSRLLCMDKQTGEIRHSRFDSLLDFVKPDDLLILNNTRVIAARLYGHKESGGKIEILIERLLGEHEALAQIKSSKSPKPGSTLYFTASPATAVAAAGETSNEDVAGKFSARVISRQDQFFHLVFDGSKSVSNILHEIGHIPLPPYIKRQDEILDHERYQTVYAQHEGAVAAPTAGLHFDKELMKSIAEKAVDIGYVTLHVGSGTFQPVRVENVLEHKMHKEFVQVPSSLCRQVKECKERGGRVIAVGTTTVRSLEAAAASGELLPFEGDTDIFIYPGFSFNVVDAMITNFHLPESTLLMLVSAFSSHENITRAYEVAVKEKYRFFSYGDAMLLY